MNSLPDQPGVTEVRNNFLRFAPNTQVLVFEVQVTDWRAWLRTPSLPAAAEWLNGQWGLQAHYEQPPQNVLPPRPGGG
jgi:hypothetical protein